VENLLFSVENLGKSRGKVPDFSEELNEYKYLPGKLVMLYTGFPQTKNS
jgi:hypothetical protein